MILLRSQCQSHGIKPWVGLCSVWSLLVPPPLFLPLLWRSLSKINKILTKTKQLWNEKGISLQWDTLSTWHLGVSILRAFPTRQQQRAPTTCVRLPRGVSQVCALKDTSLITTVGPFFKSLMSPLEGLRNEVRVPGWSQRAQLSWAAA